MGAGGRSPISTKRIYNDIFVIPSARSRIAGILYKTRARNDSRSMFTKDERPSVRVNGRVNGFRWTHHSMMEVDTRTNYPDFLREARLSVFSGSDNADTDDVARFRTLLRRSLAARGLNTCPV